jgi:hypothetical protein
MTATPSELSMAGQVAAHTRWSRTKDRTAATAPARQARIAKLAAEIDPDGELTPAEMAERIASAQKAHMKGMALASARVRRQRANP